MKTLHLTLKKQWFDMIASGEKKEEYREQKDYWFKRLTNFFEQPNSYDIYDFDTITFRKCYSKNAPTIVIECLGITEGKGNPEWGAPKENVFIIKLGEIISKQNSII